MTSSVQLTARKHLKCTEKGRVGICFFIFRSEGYGISVALIFGRKLIQHPLPSPAVRLTYTLFSSRKHGKSIPSSALARVQAYLL